jgi:hypothetical protein
MGFEGVDWVYQAQDRVRYSSVTVVLLNLESSRGLFHRYSSIRPEGIR